MSEPVYLRLLPGELDRRSELAFERMRSCDLCPWSCKVNRRITPAEYTAAMEAARKAGLR